jgi:anti-sigma regulatory factor (Ser/Thr protein kinase)
MKRVLSVPATLDARAFDALAVERAALDDANVLVDARHVRWADPYGMIGLISLGQLLRDASGRPTPLQVPDAPEVLSYLERMGFLAAAAEVYELHGAPRGRRATGARSAMLVGTTPIRSHEDVHGVIDHVQERAGAILASKLGYSRADAAMFSMILSEVCQNIIEHAESGGWVGIQSYNWAKRLGRNVVIIAVHDLGIGFRGSLAREHSARFGDRWSDATALEAAFIHGVTRFRDPGRGQGLKQIRNRVGRWNGRIAIRSGTARIADIPDWDEAPPMEQGLAPVPGSQIEIILPARDVKRD